MLPRLGIFADFTFDCPVAKYVEGISDGLKKYFDVEYLDLQSSERIYKQDVYRSYDQYFSELLNKVDKLDIVEISFEFGMYGRTTENVLRRLKCIIKRAKRVVVKVHSCHMDGGGVEAFYRSFFLYVNESSKSKPILVIVNNESDARIMEELGVKYTNYPIVYYSQPKIDSLRQSNVFKNKSNKIHKLLHFKVDSGDIIIGAFGYLNAIKDYVTVVKALALLPANYKLLFLGGQHPGHKQLFKRDDDIMSIVGAIAEIDAEIGNKDDKLMNRVTFLNLLPDKEFQEIQASVDFVVAPYLETKMSASSVMAQSLQLGLKVVGSVCTTFNNLAKWYPNCFEQIDFGNYYQLRSKILAFDPEKYNNLQACNKQWTVEGLSFLYEDFYNKSLFFSPSEVKDEIPDDDFKFCIVKSDYFQRGYRCAKRNAKQMLKLLAMVIRQKN